MKITLILASLACVAAAQDSLMDASYDWTDVVETMGPDYESASYVDKYDHKDEDKYDHKYDGKYAEKYDKYVKKYDDKYDDKHVKKYDDKYDDKYVKKYVKYDYKTYGNDTNDYKTYGKDTYDYKKQPSVKTFNLQCPEFKHCKNKALRNLGKPVELKGPSGTVCSWKKNLVSCNLAPSGSFCTVLGKLIKKVHCDTKTGHCEPIKC